MGCCKRAVGVAGQKVIGCEWVVGSFAFATYPAGNSGVSDLFGSFLVVAFVVRSVWFGVLSVPKGLASGAACSVGCQVATIEAGSLNHLCLR